GRASVGRRPSASSPSSGRSSMPASPPRFAGPRARTWAPRAASSPPDRGQALTLALVSKRSARADESQRQSSTPVTVAFATLGCKLNQYDTTEVQALLESEGFRTVPFEAPAQVYVINTCTVTARADYSDRQTIRRAVARNPDAVVVVTGCYAQTNPEAVAAIPGVDLVLGTRDRHTLPGLLHEARKRVRPLVQVS